MPLKIVIAASANRYLDRLDAQTRERIKKKLNLIALEPDNINFSYPLQNSGCRSAHVGGWRILLQIAGDQLRVTDIDRRGQVYRNLKRR